MKKFIKIIARYIPDDLVTYKEYAGKPYYEIMYEENGEVIVGFGSFKIDCISEWINKYFINNKIDEVLEIVHKNKEEHAKYDRLLNPMWLRGYFDAQDEFCEKVEALRGKQE